MTDRERVLAVLRDQDYDQLPVLHFGFLSDTLWRWHAEGHVTKEELYGYADGNGWDIALCRKLGFDCNYHILFAPNTGLMPGFKTEIRQTFEDGSQHVLTGEGLVQRRAADRGGPHAAVGQ